MKGVTRLHLHPKHYQTMAHTSEFGVSRQSDNSRVQQIWIINSRLMILQPKSSDLVHVSLHGVFFISCWYTANFWNVDSPESIYPLLLSPVFILKSKFQPCDIHVTSCSSQCIGNFDYYLQAQLNCTKNSVNLYTKK